MFKFFSFKKKQKEKDHQVNSLIVNKLDKIIELLEQKEKENTAKTIQFDHVHIEHLENLVFRLDNIDIDELSGKLVIGNNIISTEDLPQSLIRKVDKDMLKKKSMSETPVPKEKMEKTSKGYRYRNEQSIHDR
jgi:hypothetical protein